MYVLVCTDVCVLRFLHRGNLDVVAIVTCGGGVGARNINTIKEREKCISSILEVDTGTVRNVYCSYTLGPQNPKLVVDVERPHSVQGRLECALLHGKLL